jgi:ubiquinol-cytochrome c reductase cytochrome c subunit
MRRRRLGPAVRTRHLLALAIGFGLFAGGVAYAQPPSGIVRPTDERGMSPLELGAQLFAGNCASCHGSDGAGVISPAQAGAGDVQGRGPSLRGVGAQAADFYLRTGYMPLDNAHEQPTRRRVQLTAPERRALVAYVASLAPGPGIPRPHPERGSVPEGMELFTEHCAGCHQVVARGGVVSGARVPPLTKSSAVEIAEAVRIGPYVMPTFTKRAISDDELDSIIAYVQSVRRPPSAGGWGIGYVGPVPEGMVAWLIAGVALVIACAMIGTRLRG